MTRESSARSRSSSSPSACRGAASSAAPAAPGSPSPASPACWPPAAASRARPRRPPSRRRAAAVNHPKTAIGNWTFANWPLYIDKKVIKDFNKEFGGKCKYVEEINDNFEFFGKVRQQLQSGKPIGRDIVTLTDYMSARWVRLGYSEPIDKKNVPNFSNLVDNLKTINYDPKREYTLPWQSGAIGLGYNPKKTGRELKSIKDLFDPKFKGRVTMFSEPYDSASAVLLSEGVMRRRPRSTSCSARSRRSTRPTRPASSASSPATTTPSRWRRATSGPRSRTRATSCSCSPTIPTCASSTRRRAARSSRTT